MDNYEEVRNWIVNAILGYKNTTALVLYGPSGNGKSLFCDILQDNVKNEIRTITDIKYLEKFNEVLNKHKIFVLEDLRSKDEIEKVKDLIYNKTIAINAKWQEPFTIKNESNYIICQTGNVDILDYHKDQRRFVFVEPLSAIHILRDILKRLNA